MTADKTKPHCGREKNEEGRSTGSNKDPATHNSHSINLLHNLTSRHHGRTRNRYRLAISPWIKGEWTLNLSIWNQSLSYRYLKSTIPVLHHLTV